MTSMYHNNSFIQPFYTVFRAIKVWQSVYWPTGLGTARVLDFLNLIELGRRGIGMGLGWNSRLSGWMVFTVN